jgi:predicted metal-dependent peptidase
LTLRGFGRTDFRPVFEYVNRLRKEGQLTKLKGLLYFTDGKGVFPAHKPDYDTAFVFIDSNATAAAKVPAWAIKVVLDPDDIKTRLPSSKGR